MFTRTLKESTTETNEPDPGPRPRPSSTPGAQKIEIHETTYLTNHVASFMRSRDRYGHLSNMTFGYPLTVNELVFQGPEGLYQALKFPNDPEIQQLIGTQRSGMDAKKTAYTKTAIRPDWDEIKPEAMRFTLAVKLLQHPRRFSDALMETGTWPIVEMSQRDQYWGAKPKRTNTVLVGVNLLGKLLTQLREQLRTNPGAPEGAARLFIQDIHPGLLLVNRRPVTPPHNLTT